ncbi:helicase HerA-like domain-containing protein, partial [Flagellimonas flava]|uniref:helicase HerA-like domain-containing protein n=1 Tax=Flagellimonas flava TaxID=570519 RepID=UPI003D662B3D
TPLAATLLRAPMSRMDVLTGAELEEAIGNSKLVKKYNEEIDGESAYEILNEKIEQAQKEAEKEQVRDRKTSSSRKSSS